MKYFILIAFFCATALAVPSKSVAPKPNLVEALKANVLPKLAVLQTHKITREKLFKLLGDNEAPGLREVVDQFILSCEEIYRIVDRTAGRLVPLFQENNLQGNLIAELPRIAQHAGIESYDAVVEWIHFWGRWGSDSPEDTIEIFIEFGILLSAIGIPYYTYYDVRELINGINPTAGYEFEKIMDDLMYDSSEQVWTFSDVLWEAYYAIENKH